MAAGPGSEQTPRSAKSNREIVDVLGGVNAVGQAEVCSSVVQRSPQLRPQKRQSEETGKELRMLLAKSIKTLWTRFGEFAEAMEYDTAHDLRQRVERLERRVFPIPAVVPELESATQSSPESDFGS